MGYGVRDLRPRSDKNDRARLTTYLANASRYATILMRRGASDVDSFNGFWPAALEEGTHLRALASVENNVTLVHGEDNDAIKALADDLARRVLSRPSESGMFPLLGDERVVNTFWQTYARIGKARQVVTDRKRNLWSTTEPNEPLKPVEIERAAAADLKVVYAFTGDGAVEEWGVDPRRVSPHAHEAACRAAIDEGRQIVGRMRGRPVFVAELAPLTEDGESAKSCMIERMHVPRPFRIRKKMVASAIAETAALACQDYDEVLFFADADETNLTSSATQAGFEVKRGYRLMVLRS